MKLSPLVLGLQGPGVAPHQELLALQLLHEGLPAGQLLQAGLGKEQARWWVA